MGRGPGLKVVRLCRPASEGESVLPDGEDRERVRAVRDFGLVGAEVVAAGPTAVGELGLLEYGRPYRTKPRSSPEADAVVTIKTLPTYSLRRQPLLLRCAARAVFHTVRADLRRHPEEFVAVRQEILTTRSTVVRDSASDSASDAAAI